MTDITDKEREVLTHLWKCRKWFGDEQTMQCARRQAELDPYQLSRIPELLQRALDDHHAKKERAA